MFNTPTPKLLAIFVVCACAQTTARIAMSQDGSSLRDRINTGIVRIMTGDIAPGSDALANLTADIAAVLDKEGEMRVLPILGDGGTRNVRDLLFLSGIDMMIVRSDIFAFLRQRNLMPSAKFKVRYILKFYDEVFHVLAKKNIKSIRQLNGKSVAIGPAGSGQALSASTLFSILGVKPKFVYLNQEVAKNKLTTGEVVAAVYTSAIPSVSFKSLPSNNAYYYLPLPFEAELRKTYERAKLTHDDYPNLISKGKKIETLRLGIVLAVYNWSQERGNRYQIVSKFIDKLFLNIRNIRKLRAENKIWRNINIDDKVPNWVRYVPAQSWLDATKFQRQKQQKDQVKTTIASESNTEFNLFTQYLEKFKKYRQESGRSVKISDKDIKGLYKQFKSWSGELTSGKFSALKVFKEYIKSSGYASSENDLEARVLYEQFNIWSENL